MSISRLVAAADTALQGLWRALIDPSVDRRLRCGRVGAVMYGFACLVGASALPFLPAGVRVGWLLAVLLTGLVSTLLLVVVPWQRLPASATLAPVILGLLLIGVGIGGLGRALPYFLAYYVLSFVFIGLTQPPGRAVVMAPLALASGLVGETRDDGQWLVALTITIVVGVIVGELLAQHTAAQRAAVKALDDVLTTITALTSCQSSRRVMERIAAGFAQLLDADGVLVAMHCPASGSDQLVVHGAYGAPPTVIGEPLPTLPATRGVPFHASGALAHMSWARATTAVRIDLPIREDGVTGVVVASWERTLAMLAPAVRHGADMLSREAAKMLDQLRYAEELARQADTDPLTGLANRRVFFRELQRLREGDAVVIIDLDHFKRLNDSLGHDAGDRELVEFAATLTRQLRGGDCAARYGGEEFALIVRGDGRRGAPALLQRVRVAWARASRVTLSAGVGVHSSVTTPQATLTAADRALYAAKQSGRDRVCFAGESAERAVAAMGHVVSHRGARLAAARPSRSGYDLGPDEWAQARAFLEQVADGDEVAVALQPILRLGDRRVVGVEALARFPSAPLSLTVEQWFDAAAHLGLSSGLEFAAARAAVAVFDVLPAPVTVSLNVSPLVLLDPAFLAMLRAHHVPFDRLIVEITEQQPVEDYASLVEGLGPLRAAGARLAVDDAGAGYASFRHILRLEPDFIKLDRGIISGIDHDPGLRALTTALVSFTAEIGAQVVAEGVEQPTELAVLERLGVAGAQGYLLARPSTDQAEWRRWFAGSAVTAR